MASSQQLPHLAPYPESSSSTFNSPQSYTPPSSRNTTSPSSSTAAHRSSADEQHSGLVGPPPSTASYEPSHLSSSAAPSTSYSALPRQLRTRIPSEIAHQLSSRTPSPLSSPQLRFDPTEPGGYHGETQFGYDFLPAVQPQLFVAPSTHPFASGVAQLQPYPLSSSSSTSSSDQAHQPHASTSTSTLAQEYQVTSNSHGTSSRMSADDKSDRSHAQEGFSECSRGGNAVDRARAVEHDRTFTGSDGWDHSHDDHPCGQDDMHWDGSGGEEDDDGEDRDREHEMDRRGSMGGERGEVSLGAEEACELA